MSQHGFQLQQIQSFTSLNISYIHQCVDCVKLHIREKKKGRIHKSDGDFSLNATTLNFEADKSVDVGHSLTVKTCPGTQSGVCLSPPNQTSSAQNDSFVYVSSLYHPTIQH